MSASVHLWQYYGLRSQVWLYRLLQGMRRYTPHLLLREGWIARATADEFPWPAEQRHFFPLPSLLPKALAKMTALLRTGRWDVLNARDAKYLRGLCAELNAEVVHLHFGWLACAILGGRVPLGGRPLVSLYGSDVFRITLGERYFARLGAILKEGTHVHVTSQHLKDGAVALGANPDRVHVVPVGIWLPELPAEDACLRQREARRSARPVRLITVGRLVDYKAPQQLPSVARLLEDKGLDFEWRLIGDGPLLPAIRQQAEALGVADRFKIMGGLPFKEVHTLRWDSDIMVHNAVIAPDGGRECLGVTLLEAQAIGIPVVSCRVGGIPEAVADGVSGLLVESGDIEGIAERIVRLSNDPEERLRMGQGALRHARDRFDSRQLGERIERIYDAMKGG